MSFASNLSTKINEYTSFSVFGKTIQLPYRLGGKLTPTQIRGNIVANLPSTSSQSAIQKWANSNTTSTGIDCSGFAYYVLNEASGGAVMNTFNVSYAYGVSAANLTSTSYGYKLTRAMDVTAGCLMNTDNGGHVIVVYSVTKGSDGLVNRIDYAHSNGSKGPHKGYITIGDPGASLDSSRQTWHDSAYTDSQAKGYFNYVMRLSCLPSA